MQPDGNGINTTPGSMGMVEIQLKVQLKPGASAGGK
jgi:hypothetical protein